MRLLPVVILIGLMVPTTSNKGWAGIANLPKTPTCLGKAILPEVRDALLRGDVYELRPIFPLNGISISCPDGSVPTRVLRQAASAWNSAMRAPTFRVTSRGQTPYVVVTVVKLINGQNDLQGQVETPIADPSGASARIQISNQDAGRLLNVTAMSAVLSHELGHLLGLEDSSGLDQTGPSVMGEFDPDHLVLGPSEHDVQTVFQLRALVRNTIRTIRSSNK